MIRAIYVLEIGAAVLVNISALTLLVLRYIPFPATAARNRHNRRLSAVFLA